MGRWLLGASVTHIEVFIPAYNVDEFIDRCLCSVADQDYDDYSVVMVNDASTDATGVVMASYFQSHEDWRIVHNPVNQKMPKNLTLIRQAGFPQDVVFILDGDDFLPDPGVLSTVAAYYEDPDLWLTYGSYTRYPDPSVMPNPALPFPDWVIKAANYRQYSKMALVYNHPLTFRRWLFNEVSDAELCDDEGEWFTRCYDHALMMPMLELATDGHFRWLPEILYVYNEENVASEAKDDARAESDRIHNQINARPKRAAL
jgi:glycosyltransferase involved in cell wall biosynthesis